MSRLSHLLFNSSKWYPIAEKNITVPANTQVWGLTLGTDLVRGTLEQDTQGQVFGYLSAITLTINDDLPDCYLVQSSLKPVSLQGNIKVNVNGSTAKVKAIAVPVSAVLGG